MSIHSISLLDSLSFWFLLGGGCPTSCANRVEHSGMSWVARGGCAYLWGWGKGADILQKIKEALVKGDMGLGRGGRGPLGS